MRKEQIAERLQALIEKGERINTENHVRTKPFSEWSSQSVALLQSVLGTSHIYAERFATSVGVANQSHLDGGIGILRAAKEDAELGLLRSVRELVAAEVFSDFLEMAKHLYETGYHIPAASLIGAVLEDGMRKIAESRDVAVRPGDDLSVLNQRLGDADVYSRLKQRQIQPWIDLRNRADHGQFDEVTQQDVGAMLTAVESFLAEYL